MKPMNTLLDVVEEAKVRTVFWAICVFGISYFLSHTSKSMWINIPLSVLILATIRYLSYEVDFRWKVRAVPRQTYLSHLEKKQLSADDLRLSLATTTSKWRRKIDSPIVETAIDEFINKIIQDFVVDLWYSSITPDKEAPELIRTLILDVLGEISGRIKEINLVELLTRDMVDLIGNQLDLFRKNQSEIGTDMGTLSFEERDERLKHHLMASRELHPALVSPEFEHKVLQQMVGGLLALVLRPKEAQCPLVHCISRELLTCLVVQPIMNLVSPVYVNELIEYIFLSNNDPVGTDVFLYKPPETSYRAHGDIVSEENTLVVEPEHSRTMSSTYHGDVVLSKADRVASGLKQRHQTMLQGSPSLPIQPRAAEWALVLEAATKRRTQVLTPENLENMWTKGRNYKKKTAKLMHAEATSGSGKIDFVTLSVDMHASDASKELSAKANKNNADLLREEPSKGFHSNDGPEECMRSVGSTNQLKRSNSTPDMDTSFTCKSGENIIYKDYYSTNFRKHKEEPNTEMASRSESSSYVPKLKCRVGGAYFENVGSKSFAVYSIEVTDAENKTWFVKRRYRNFERLHRHLKEIRNYSLSLPPKRFLSSSIDDYFVHQRCILLNKYLQDLLAIANIAEQHEVWDFFSASSKNYSFGKSTSVMKTLAVNMDDAMDDIVRQFKRKVVGSSPSHINSSTQAEHSMTLPWNEDANKLSLTCNNIEAYQSVSDEDAHEDHSSTLDSGWHSDNELTGLPPRIIKRKEESSSLVFQKSEQSEQFKNISLDNSSTSNNLVASDTMEDLARVPPEWTPTNVSVPLLNLVDNIFQLNRRGWLRRQVFWISKQILQLIMEDAIDDWILRQIHWLRKDEVIALGIHWVQDILWPNGTFFIKFGNSQENGDGIDFSQKSVPKRSHRYSDKVGGPSSFEFQLEAARRASDVKKMIVGGAPTALVSLIGHRQYKRCAKDVYNFLQSSVCLKQLGYSMLELVIVSIFPELRDLILEIHQKFQANKVASEAI